MPSVREAISAFGRIDVMVNNAAIIVVKPIDEHTPEEWDRTFNVNVKSLYWYDKANFAAAGLTVPKTQAELEALIEKVKASGKTPLCYGMESGSATGWPGRARTSAAAVSSQLLSMPRMRRSATGWSWP